MNSSRKIAIGFVAVIIAAIGIVTAVSASSIRRSSSNKPTTIKNEPFSGEKVITVSEIVAFQTETVNDSSLEYGESYIKTKGANGKKDVRYKVTYEKGKEISRKKVDENITQQPVNEIVIKGTKVMWHCVDTTSFDRNRYNDNYCTSSTGEGRYVRDSEACRLDPTYHPSQAGASRYNDRC